MKAKFANKKRKRNAAEINGSTQKIKKTRLEVHNSNESSDEEGVLELLEKEYQKEHPKDHEENAVTNDEAEVYNAEEDVDAEIQSVESVEDSDIEEEGEMIEVKSKKKKPEQILTVDNIGDFVEQLKGGSIRALRRLVMAFSSAVRASGSDTHKVNIKKLQYRNRRGRKSSVPTLPVVRDSALFNAIVRACIAHLLPSVNSILQRESDEHQKAPSSHPHWLKVKAPMKLYLRDLLSLMEKLKDPDALSLLAKHLTGLIDYYLCLPKLVKPLMRFLVRLWSCANEDAVRVLAMLSLFRLVQQHARRRRSTTTTTTTSSSDLLLSTVKAMLSAYSSSAASVRPSTLAALHFMRRSLVEFFALDPTLAYTQAFLQLRQLAIALRKASEFTAASNKDAQMAVLSQRFVQSLALWTHLTAQHSQPPISELVYPVMQLVLGTARLKSSPRYLPLRFQCVRLLHQLGRAHNLLTPALSLLLEVFELVDFNKRHTSASLKPLPLQAMLALSKSQLKERGFRDAVSDTLFELLAENLALQAHSVAFPEYVLPVCQTLRSYLKRCKIANYQKPFALLLAKIKENVELVERRRKEVGNFVELREIDAVEAKLRKESPFIMYHAKYQEMRRKELIRQSAGFNDEDDEDEKEDDDDEEQEDDELEVQSRRKKSKSIKIKNT